MTKIYFQDYLDEQTLIKGWVDLETKVGLSEIYKKTTVIGIDINENESLENPNTNEQFVHQFALDALNRYNTKYSTKYSIQKEK